MGTWGPNIFQNDDAIDIRETYRTKLLLGLSDEDAEESIISEFGDDPNQLFWLPLAVSQWKVGRLSDRAKEKALATIQWEQTHIDEFGWKGKLPEKRRQILEETRKLLCSPMPQRKKLRLPWWSWKCPWPIGSVLQYKLTWPKENNPYLGHYVLLQIVGIYETPPDRLPEGKLAFHLYDWHSSTPPAEYLSSILEHGTGLIPLAPLPDGTERVALILDGITKDVIKEHDIQCISKVPITQQKPSVIPMTYPPTLRFEETIKDSLERYEESRAY